MFLAKYFLNNIIQLSEGPPFVKSLYSKDNNKISGMIQSLLGIIEIVH